jgi:hypothetical protein
VHRIDSSGHFRNLFTEGDILQGIPATTVSGDWLNDVQEELCTVIEASGASLIKGRGDQLLAAITLLAARVLPDAAVAAALEPQPGSIVFILGSDGGVFRAAAGASAATYVSDGEGACGTVIAYSDGGSAWLRVHSSPLNVLWWGAHGYNTKEEAEAGIDSSGAIERTCAVALQTGVTVAFPDCRYFRTTSTVRTQPDGAWSALRIQGNNSVIVKDHAGVGVMVTGGAAYQYVDSLHIVASSGFQASDFHATYNQSSGVIIPDYPEHGFRIVNTRTRLTNCTATNHRGAGVYIESTRPNSNKSRFDVTTRANGMAGFYVSGSWDDLSVIPARLQCQAEFGPAFHVENDVHLRQWDMWIYAEACCRGGAATSPGSGDPLQSQVYIGKAEVSRFWIYSEHGGSVEEIRLGSNVENCDLWTARQNKDVDIGASRSNMWHYGHTVSQPHSTRQSEPLVIAGSQARYGREGEWVRIPIVGHGGTYGYLKGEGQRLGFQSPNGTELAIEDGKLLLGPTAVYDHPATAPADLGAYAVTFTGALNSGEAAVVLLAAEADECTCVLRMSLAAMSSDGGADATLVQSFVARRGQITSAMPEVSDIQGPFEHALEVNHRTQDLEMTVRYLGGRSASSRWVLRADVIRTSI